MQFTIHFIHSSFNIYFYYSITDSNDEYSESIVDTSSEIQTEVLSIEIINIRQSKQSGHIYKKHRGMQKMIVISLRVSSKIRNLVTNLRGSSF